MRIERSLRSFRKRLEFQVASFSDLWRCLKGLRNGECDLLILDLDHPPASDHRPLVELRQVCPCAKILALVTHADVVGAVRAMKEGALDCIEKPLDGYMLRSKVECLLDGRGGSLDLGHTHLTTMETLVLGRVLEGKTTREIARDLHRSPRTIEVHRKNIMRKLEVSNVVDLVRLAIRKGFCHVRWSRHYVRYPVQA